MASINTYYSQALLDRMTVAAQELFPEDPRRMDKFIKACLKFGMEHLVDLKKVVEA
jgi:hypothetical protein